MLMPTGFVGPSARAGLGVLPISDTTSTATPSRPDAFRAVARFALPGGEFPLRGTELW
jgi:hypothetical protein